MKKYAKPTFEIAMFEVEDVITSSGVIVNSDSLTGASAEMYKIYSENSSAGYTNVSVFTW